MPLLTSVLGWSAFGFGARCFQLGIQKRPIFAAPGGHIAAASVFGALGYYLYGAQERQMEMIAAKKKILLANRERENAAAAAASSA